MAIHVPQHNNPLVKPLKSAMAKHTPKKGGFRSFVDAFFAPGQVVAPRVAKHVRFATLGGYFVTGQMSYQKFGFTKWPERDDHKGVDSDYDSDDDEEAIPFPWDFYDMKNKVVVDDEGWDDYEIEGVDNVAFGEYPGYDHPRREVPEDELTLVQRRAPMQNFITSILLALRTRVPRSRAPSR